MDQFIVNSMQSFRACVDKLQETFNKDKYLHVKINSNKRTLTQDSLVHIWYHQLGEYEGNTDEHVKSYCKYHFGLGVLGTDPDFTQYLNMIRNELKPMDYDDRIKFMKYVKVTSLMSTKQHSDYMKKVQEFYGDQGLNLKSKKEL